MMRTAYLLTGQVMHERLRPVQNRFVYPVFCLRLNLAYLGELNNRWFGVDCWRPLSIATRDYGARDGSDLQGWMRGLLKDAAIEADGEIWLQTFPRIFGYAFNPVNFWFCHDKNGGLRAVLAEVNNTFGEHHRYLLQAAEGGDIRADSDLHSIKALHVSPFCPVEGHYQFCFKNSPDSAFVAIDYFDQEGLLIKTAIAGRHHSFTPAHLRRALLAQPFLTLGVVAKIHWQALRLWLKRVPFYRKPQPPLHPVSHPLHLRSSKESQS
ncbi:DUF1365 domain-containing protein [Iodobacter ciconiae]|uniref:DUF1365 domain-containing protein n=2 Tax=Iodobacter ciconiae TaxID=2496266 RepID=A0A3S8ZXQ9_9NEIS|nr:DUF1365 domain-containing protein [Iodobacter ciconiae]